MSTNKLICYWLFCIGFVDLFAVSIVFPLVPQHAKELGASPSLIGLFGSIYGAIQLFSSPIIGHLGDDHGRIKILFLCLMVAAIGYGTSSLCVYSLLLLSLLRFVAGIFKHTQDLCRNCLADYSSVGEKTKSVSQFNALSNIGFIIGPSISGLVSKWLGLASAVSLCFLLCGILFILNGAIVWFVIWPLSEQSNTEKGATRKAKDNEKNLWDKMKGIDWKVHQGLFLSRFLFALAVLLYRSSFILGVKQLYPDLTSADVGYLVSYNGFLGFVFGIIIGWVSVHQIYAGNEEKLQMHASIMIPIGFLIISLSPNVIMLLIGLAFLSVGTTSSRACGVVLTTKRSKPDEAGKLLGFSSSMISVARSAAPLVAGIAQEFSFSAPALISLSLSVVALYVYYHKVFMQPRPKPHLHSD
uniref:Major facilitator superfamily domain-containing protein 9 n=1 Tax=Phallusia mammillata TaxID=59560 RepID=A0A6F9DLG1_9ASCI|nr:major facilitator superfamily domain-containing protein 9 [Phallusia mammillata]